MATDYLTKAHLHPPHIYPYTLSRPHIHTHTCTHTHTHTHTQLQECSTQTAIIYLCSTFKHTHILVCLNNSKRRCTHSHTHTNKMLAKHTKTEASNSSSTHADSACKANKHSVNLPAINRHVSNRAVLISAAPALSQFAERWSKTYSQSQRKETTLYTHLAR